MTYIAYYQPEDIARARVERGRKLAIVALGLSPEGPETGDTVRERVIVRKAAIEKPAHVTRSSNYNNEDERAEIGRKLALVAGIL